MYNTFNKNIILLYYIIVNQYMHDGSHVRLCEVIFLILCAPLELSEEVGLIGTYSGKKLKKHCHYY